MCQFRLVPRADFPDRQQPSYPEPRDYVSVACLTNDHVSCQGRPIVHCACPCHRNGSVDPSGPDDHTGPGGPGGRSGPGSPV